MEPKKTTILLPPAMHARLTELAARRGSSMGGLIREACAVVYGLRDPATAVAAVQELGAMALPVGSVAAMKAESVAAPKALP